MKYKHVDVRFTGGIADGETKTFAGDPQHPGMPRHKGVFVIPHAVPGSEIAPGVSDTPARFEQHSYTFHESRVTRHESQLEALYEGLDTFTVMGISWDSYK